MNENLKEYLESSQKALDLFHAGKITDMELLIMQNEANGHYIFKKIMEENKGGSANVG